MTIEECYQKLGGNYIDVRERLINEKLISRFLEKFINDDSYLTLCSGIQEGKRDQAFRAAHTLKGICQNLGFGILLKSTGAITELLRHEAAEIPAEAAVLMESVKHDYESTVSIILAYLSEHQS